MEDNECVCKIWYDMGYFTWRCDVHGNVTRTEYYNKTEGKTAYIPCEHLKSEMAKDKIHWSPDWRRIFLADRYVAVLCEKCSKALAYDILIEFNLHSRRPHPMAIHRGR